MTERLDDQGHGDKPRESETPDGGRSSLAGALAQGTPDNVQGAAPRLPAHDALKAMVQRILMCVVKGDGLYNFGGNVRWGKIQQDINEAIDLSFQSAGTRILAGGGDFGFTPIRQATEDDVPPPAVVASSEPYQLRVDQFMLRCFGFDIAEDTVERNHRFLEESLELVQALGCTAADAHMLVDYVYGRPTGEPHQEAGGVMVTLAALCTAAGLDMTKAGEDELARVFGKIDIIREKQKAKPKGSPLPEYAERPTARSATEPSVAQRMMRYEWLLSYMTEGNQETIAWPAKSRGELERQIDAKMNATDATTDSRVNK